MKKRPGLFGGPSTAHLLRYSSIGLEMGIAVAIGLFFGWWLDKRFDTSPWLTILFLLFGIAAGFKNILQLLREELHDGEPAKRDDKDRP